MKVLYQQQKDSLEILKKALQKWGGALDASETGTGKTLKAVELCRDLGLRAVVVCPKAVIPSWKRTFVEQGVAYHDVLNYEKIRTGNTPWLAKSGKKFLWKLPENSIVIFDESHRCKSHDTLNAAMMMAARAVPCLALSATAAENPVEMKALGCILRLHSGKDYIRWALQHGAMFNQWNALEFDPLEGLPKLDALNKVLYPDRAHKLTRLDLGSHFKETSISYDPLDFNDKGKIKKILDEVAEELERLMNKQREDQARAAEDDRSVIALTRILRARQQVELLKVPVLADLIDDYLDQGHSVAVFLNFNESIDALARLLKTPCGIIRGGQTETERQEAIDAFQADRSRVIVANIAAGGVGVSLHDETGKFPRVSLISPSYNAKELQQCLGRVDRVGAKTDSVQRILIAEGTIEETVLEKIMQKIRNLDLLHSSDPLQCLQQPVSGSIQGFSTTEKQDNTMQASEEHAAHAEFSPSQLKYFRGCPGYAPSGGTSDAAESGTRIHEALETGDFSKLTDFEEYIAGLCNDAVVKILAREQFDLFDPNVKEIREIRVTVECGDESTFGTCDRLFIKGTKGIAMDYKTGVGKIDDAEDNMQAKAYAVGIFQAYPQIKTLDFWFIVPRRDELSVAEFTRDHLPEFQQEIANIIRKARKAKKCFGDNTISIDQLRPDPQEWCRFCANAYRCPAISAAALKIAKRYVENTVEVPDEVHGHAMDDPEVISKLLKLAPVVEKCIAGWKNRARQMAFEEGLDIPGYVRVERNGSRKITNASVAWDHVKDFMTMDQFFSAVGDISASKFEEIVSSTAERGKKKERVSTIMAELFAAGAVSVSNSSQFLKASNE